MIVLLREDFSNDAAPFALRRLNPRILRLRRRVRDLSSLFGLLIVWFHRHVFNSGPKSFG